MTFRCKLDYITDRTVQWREKKTTIYLKSGQTIFFLNCFNYFKYFQQTNDSVIHTKILVSADKKYLN